MLRALYPTTPPPSSRPTRAANSLLTRESTCVRACPTVLSHMMLLPSLFSTVDAIVWAHLPGGRGGEGPSSGERYLSIAAPQYLSRARSIVEPSRGKLWYRKHSTQGYRLPLQGRNRVLVCQAQLPTSYGSSVLDDTCSTTFGVLNACGSRAGRRGVGRPRCVLSNIA